MPDVVRFSETLRGHVSPQVDGPHEVAWARGRADGTEVLFMLTVVTPDVDAMVADPLHRSPVFGCVLAPALHPRPLRVEEGHLDLFVDADPEGRVLHMRYGLALRDEDGRAWFLRGFKEVCRRRWWPTFAWDGTTLYVDVHEGRDGPPRWRGVLREGVVGVLAQGLSFRGDGGWLGLRGIVRYLGYYMARVTRVMLGPRTPSPREAGRGPAAG